MKEVEEALTSPLADRQQVLVSITGRRQMRRSKVVCLRKLTHWHNLFPMDYFTVLDCLSEVVSDLHALGLNLNIPPSSLETILSSSNDLDKQRVELVKKWLGSVIQPPCWWTLIEALKQIDMKVLAAELEKEHGEFVRCMQGMWDL